METKSFDLKKFLMKYVMYIFLVLMCIILAIASDKFLTVTNLMTIIKQISIQSIVAIGMTMIIISGNIDLSVGSLVALCSVSGAMIMNKGLPMAVAIIASILIGAFSWFHYRWCYCKTEITFIPCNSVTDDCISWSGTDNDKRTSCSRSSIFLW